MPAELPLELIHEIFVQAAQSSPSSCRALCKVSTWVRHLALPLLYIAIPADAIEILISLRPACSPSPGFKPAESVRNVWVFSRDARWRDIMQHCTRLSHIASTHQSLVQLVGDEGCFINPGSTTNLQLLMLKNPGGGSDDMDWSMYSRLTDRNRHFFRRVTHLRLADPTDFDIGISFVHMDRLTHLATPMGGAEEVNIRRVFEDYSKYVLDVLAHTSVEVFVIVLSHDNMPEDKCQDIEEWVCRLRDGEASGVYVVRQLCDHLEDEWDAEVRGGVTIWERAVTYTQLLVDRRRSKVELTMSVDLPHEVLCRIFRNAAASSTPSCRTLCEVSTWVRHLALPLLYRTIVITNAVRLDAFDRLITSATSTCPPSATFRPANVVRHLWVPFASETLMSVVRHCDNVTHLAIHHHDLLRLPDVTTPNPPEHHGCPSTRAHTGTGDLHIFVLRNQELEHRKLPSYGAIGAHGLFSRITHLRLGDPLGAFSQVPIKYMPRLTHVAVPYFDDEEEGFDDIMADVFNNKSVKVLVMALEYENLCKMERQMIEGWVREYRSEDARVYAVTQLYSTHEMEWDAEARGSATIWERAVDYTQLLMDRWGLVSGSAPTHDVTKPYINLDGYLE